MKHTNRNRFSSLFYGGLLAAFILLFQSSVFGQGITSSAIKGKVTDDSGVGIAGVEVTVTHHRPERYKRLRQTTQVDTSSADFK